MSGGDMGDTGDGNNGVNSVNFSASVNFTLDDSLLKIEIYVMCDLNGLAT